MKKKQKKLTKAEREAYAIVGAAGGRACARKHGKKHMKKIGQSGASARWGKK